MKKYLISLLISISGSTSFGQTNTQKIFNNLPLDKSVEELNQILKEDTTKYKFRTVNLDRYYYSIKPDSFFNLLPTTSEITTYNFKPHSDSSSYPVLLRFVTIPRKNNNSKKVSATYNEIVDIFKKEYEYSKPQYIKGIRKEKSKETRVDEWTTYFYSKKGDARHKLSVTWFDERKFAHEFIIEYVLN
jgi:hypothetical protein